MFTTMLDEAVHGILLYFLGANQISILEIAFLNAGPLLHDYAVRFGGDNQLVSIPIY